MWEYELSRSIMFDLAWSMPMRRLADELKVSTTSLKTRLSAANIPLPDQGHWAKKPARRRRNVKLPERLPGMTTYLCFGEYFEWHPFRGEPDNFLIASCPVRPEFHESLVEMRQWAERKIGKVSVPKSVRNWHREIQKLLHKDEIQREKNERVQWSVLKKDLVFDTTFERRRLRILQTLFMATARAGGKPEIVGREGRDLCIRIHGTRVNFELDASSAKTNRDTPVRRYEAQTPMQLSILSYCDGEITRTTWGDSREGKLEARLGEIAVEIVMAAEAALRESEIWEWEHRTERRNRIIEERDAARQSAEREEREHQEKLEQRRINSLLDQASRLQQARVIREYVQDVEALLSSHVAHDGKASFERWKKWALYQADRMDPVHSGEFMTLLKDEEQDVSP